MNSTSICLKGDPMAAAIIALRLLESDPDVAIFLPLDGLLQAEGETFPADHSIEALRPLVTREWTGYFEEVGGELSLSTRGICFIDPLLTYEALQAAGVQDLTFVPDDATELEAPSFDPFVSPSQILAADEGIPLDLPVLYDPLEESAEGRYDQVLPLAEGLVMVRQRIALGPLFAVQENVLGLRTI